MPASIVRVVLKPEGVDEDAGNARQLMVDLLKQLFQPQAGANDFIERVLINDHIFHHANLSLCRFVNNNMI